MQLLTSLRYMASGSFQLSIADCLEMSVASVCKYLAYVTRAIAALAPEYIQFPSPSNVAGFVENFQSVAGMLGVIGCIDCTHVPIRSPGGNDAERYRCRKGYFSINVQGICDPDLKFTNIIASWPGSAHDSRIFDNSKICHLLEQGHHAGYLLGDSGYPCRKYLLTPILSPSNDKEKNYNTAHAKTRNTIERAFGVLKRRFACLGQPLRTKLETSKRLIMACAVLHNLAITENIDIAEEEDTDELEHDAVHCENNDNRLGFDVRNNVVEQWF
ncbi:putative nuclease HARBI1 [Penaeus japonicus]|uniref:putative nuclease HARBI1 n=1 Tax=Penaeus japonicus TaxID=27405 RepID=UPI001C7121C3|nr:putative nuclease HARBI1 [Penaeus japonicus]